MLVEEAKALAKEIAEVYVISLVSSDAFTALLLALGPLMDCPGDGGKCTIMGLVAGGTGRGCGLDPVVFGSVVSHLSWIKARTKGSLTSNENGTCNI